MNTLGANMATEWKATINNIYGDTYYAWSEEETGAKAAFCKRFDNAMVLAKDLFRYEGEDLYNMIDTLKFSCRELNRMWDEGEKE